MTAEAAPAVTTTGTRRFGAVVAIGAVVAVLDQVTKSWAVSALDDHDVDLVWTLRLHLQRNTGAAFSLNQGRGGLIAVAALVMVGVLLWMGRTDTTKVGAVALGLVLGGAIGNLLDRALRDAHAVIDFIDLQWWPVFNVADMGVFIGGGLLILASFRE